LERSEASAIGPGENRNTDFCRSWKWRKTGVNTDGKEESIQTIQAEEKELRETRRGAGGEDSIPETHGGKAAQCHRRQ
jgi:hypothetical protein